MKIDIRTEAAKYYDRNPGFLNDIPFYLARVPSPDCAILELGCGTGRVTLPLAGQCGFIQGIDLSPAMVGICQDKLRAAGLPAGRAQAIEGDISAFDLGRTFDWIIAPFRVLQNLETDAEIDGLFTGIRRHLAPGGSCILNVFRPFRGPEEMRQLWATREEKLSWEVPVEGGRIACYDRRARIASDPERLILYPELIYRTYAGEALVDESVLKIVMRCYYPVEFEQLVRAHGFTILKRWGGYAGEPYGEGPELVLQFGA